MPRKSPIRHLSENDKAALRLLWCCQYCKREQLPISDNRLKAFMNNKLVERCVNCKGDFIIRRTEQGKNFISKLSEYQGRKPYVASTATMHNLKLASVFSTLTVQQQERWRTERELTDLCQDRLEWLREHDFDRWRLEIDREYSACDGGLVDGDGGIEILIEVTTDNYGSLELKENFAHVLNAPISYSKA